jgi:uncharacterized protein (TIGR03663 family)
MGKRGKEAREMKLTVEAALYFLIAILAAGMRILALGARPMQEAEASQAFASWLFSQGEEPKGYSPLLLTGVSILFSLFGASEFTARLPPAIFGTALVLSPLLLRHRLGRVGALISSFMLAISPSTLFFSRFLGSEIFVTAGALGLVCGLFGYLDEPKPNYLHMSSVALALLLSAGPGAYTFLLAIGAFVLAAKFFISEKELSAIEAAFRRAKEEGLLKKCTITFAIAFLLISTCFLLNLGGLGESAENLADWIASFKPKADGHPWYYHLQILSIYELMILAFGLGGFIYFWRKRNVFTTFLAYWAGVAFLVYIFAGGRRPGDVLLILVPLTLSAGRFIGHLVEEMLTYASWEREGVFLGLSLLISVYLFLMLAGYAATGKQNYLWMVFLIFFLLAVFVIIYSTYFGSALMLRTGGSSLALVLLIVTIGLSCNLNYSRSSDPRELIVASPTSNGVLDMVETLKRISAQREGDPYTLALTVHEGAGQVLFWYLRNFPEARFVEGLGPDVKTPVVITPYDLKPSLGGQYFGQDFVIRKSWRLDGLSGFEILRWLIYRKAPTPVSMDSVVLWVKVEE